MNVYARIRKIEDPIEFKHFVNAILASEYRGNFQSIKEWKDSGVDGYVKNKKIVFAVYCPVYPERAKLEQYKKKITSDMRKLRKASKKGRFNMAVKEWVFVTPDDLPIEIIDHIHRETAEAKWKSRALTAVVLAQMFIAHKHLYQQFPTITAGLQLDKVPSVSVHFGRKRHNTIEIFNDGTEHLTVIEFFLWEDGKWRKCSEFQFETDDYIRGEPHELNNLRTGERQYCINVPISGGFRYKIIAIGIESGRTFVKEGLVAST